MATLSETPTRYFLATNPNPNESCKSYNRAHKRSNIPRDECFEHRCGFVRGAHPNATRGSKFDHCKAPTGSNSRLLRNDAPFPTGWERSQVYPVQKKGIDWKTGSEVTRTSYVKTNPEFLASLRAGTGAGAAAGFATGGGVSRPASSPPLPSFSEFGLGIGRETKESKGSLQGPYATPFTPPPSSPIGNTPTQDFNFGNLLSSGMPQMQRSSPTPLPSGAGGAGRSTNKSLTFLPAPDFASLASSSSPRVQSQAQAGQATSRNSPVPLPSLSSPSVGLMNRRTGRTTRAQITQLPMDEGEEDKYDDQYSDDYENYQDYDGFEDNGYDDHNDHIREYLRNQFNHNHRDHDHDGHGHHEYDYDRPYKNQYTSRF